MDTLPITTPRQAGIYVRQAREAQGITRAALAKKAGVSERLLASLELGDATGIRRDKLLAVFNALGIGLFVQSDNDSIQRRKRTSVSRTQMPCQSRAQAGGSLDKELHLPTVPCWPKLQPNKAFPALRTSPLAVRL